MFFGESSGKEGGNSSGAGSKKNFGDEVEGYFMGRSSASSKL